MSTKQIRARLERLELIAKSKRTEEEEEKKLPFDFPIDPKVVQEIDDEHEFLKQVKSPFCDGWRRESPATPEEIETRARIAALARAIGCPPCYGFKEYWDDEDRLTNLHRPRPSKAESAQAQARMEAYKASPEGQARLRLDYLENGSGLLTPTTYEEMERLIKLYPEPWAQPKWTNLVSSLLNQRGTSKDRKLRFEKHQRWIKEREERLRSKVKPPKRQLGVDWRVKKYIEALRKNGCPTF